MKILLTGRNGQVGWELERALAPLGEVVATDRSTLDLADADAIQRSVREARPDVIVNAAAYTAVDRAESEPELAYKVNARAPGVLAEEAKRCHALLVHFSTDYVFDGEKPGAYTEQDVPGPLNVYGETKLQGEQAVVEGGCRHLILRTSWVYGPRGRNFLLTILAKAQAGQVLRVVNDQFGAPTSCLMIASAVRAAIEPAMKNPALGGIYHLSASGETTWYEFACAIVEGNSRSAVHPIAARDFVTAARRPRNSVLDNSKIRRQLGIRLAHWRAGMAEVLGALARPGAAACGN